MISAAAGAILISSGSAWAQAKAPINIPPQSLSSALYEFGGQTGRQVMFSPGLTASKTSKGVSAQSDEQAALTDILEGTGLTFRREGDIFMIVQAGEGGSGPQSESAGGDVDALIVTAQKREENIQDVPIAISAFSQEDLTRSQVAGGPDLMTQVPNFTFTKTNFTGYSIQIRGIGTQAISATTDPAVAVAFNNTPFVRNRFFEQEFYDLERVEVLRGPQGTLYGRNATAGVVNLISAKPKFDYEAKLSGDIGAYKSKRLEGMVNIPLVEDLVALRLAGAWTQREGYAVNQFTGSPIDGRDLWSTRVSLRLAPSDDLDINLIWEHFDEDDDRIRSGKQLCQKGVRTAIGAVSMPVESEPGVNSSPSATYNQGCLPASLYAPESFQTPNGFSLPYIHPLKQLGLPTTSRLDPYASATQSRDLRVIESLVDPEYRAKSDIFEMQLSWDFSDSLSIQSETAYSTDELFSTQDYNRFTTSRGIFSQAQYEDYIWRVSLTPGALKDGVFCDPQIGCSDRLVAVDLSTALSTNFSQELRLSSDYEGPFNFSLGANFTRYDTEDKYYVFINSLSLWSAVRRGASVGEPYQAGVTDNSDCIGPPTVGDPLLVYPVTGCIYMDPNPIGSLNDLGHNYFLSKNPYRLISYAAFGEAYYEIADNLKVTAGLRYTVDKKHAPLIPSWLISADSFGYPVKEVLDLEWSEPTGRLAIDWKPDFSFTDETLLYGSYAHGYKAGGANPPPMVVTAGQLQGVAGAVDSVLHPKTFDAEFVDAFEVGSKNTLLDGRMTLNANAFYYDYKGYQISQIIDRSAVNSNFDATVWGVEVEADWRISDNLRIGFKGGYENTSLADGSKAIDLMDRTAGHDDWVVAKPFPSLASNCILPVSLVTFGGRINTLPTDGTGGQILGDVGFCVHAYIEGLDPVTQLEYTLDPQVWSRAGTISNIGSNWAGYHGFNPESAPNNGEGFDKDLSGNELPNAPHYTGTLTADYTMPLNGDWVVNLHADFYYQSESWTRVFNTPGYDRLKAYTNLNLAAILTNEADGWRAMFYMKNVFDRDSITGAFLNSDDSGLTTNVFLTEPRLYGVRVTKEFSDIPLLGSWLRERPAHPAGEPYRFTLEVGGGAARFDAGVENYAPDWLDIYDAAFPRPIAVDDEELDWGDQRDVKLTYAPADNWRVSAAYRFGKTNGADRAASYEHVPGGLFAGFKYATDPTDVTYQASEDNHWIATVKDQERYDIVDFMVGVEVGIGLMGDGDKSLFSVGLRYADFDSLSHVEMDGVPYRYSPALFSTSFVNTTLPQRHFNEYTYGLQSERGFEGMGPIGRWDASLRLLGDEVQHADLNWSIGGGVLFGDQKAASEETRLARYFLGADTITPTATLIDDTVARSRTDSATVPNLSLSLGLSYEIDRVKISTGYSFDRYFKAIDGGFEDAKSYDRTIQGPFVRLSFGFGG